MMDYDCCTTGYKFKDLHLSKAIRAASLNTGASGVKDWA